MSELMAGLRHRRHVLRPFALLGLLAVLFALLPLLRSGATIDQTNLKNVLETLASLGLVALALGLTMIIGEFDLSVSSMFLLGGMLAVKTGVDSPLVGVLIAVACGLVVGVVQGFAISRMKIHSMAVTLGGFMTLLGLVYVISKSESVRYANPGVGDWLDKTVLGIFSPRILFAIAIVIAVGAVFGATTIGRDLRAIGSDRKASHTAGVRVGLLTVAVFALSGVLTAFAGSMQSYALGYSNPDQSVAPLIFATTAALLGGVSLAGGRGNPIGIAAGVLSLALVTEAIPILRSAEYVNALVPAVLLLLVVVVEAPDTLRWWKVRQARRGTSHIGMRAPPREGRT